MAEHRYELDLLWTGDRGLGTESYRAYGRNHIVSSPVTDAIMGSADPQFLGDPSRWNPEQLFLASIANCHLLWYLHLASRAGVVVTDYRDHPTGTMRVHPDGSGEFTAITLRPTVTVTPASDSSTALALHDDVGRMCFIARSVNVLIAHRAEIVVG
ncbi:OsmC family protein [Williamsia sp. M5A3_1d]